MEIKYNESPPIPDLLVSPIWQHLYDCVDGRSNLTDIDRQLKEILADFLAAPSLIAQQRQENLFFRLITGNNFRLLYSWIRQRGIENQDTIEDIAQDSILHFIKTTLPKFSPTGISVVGCCRTYLKYAVQATVSNHFKKQRQPQLASLDDRLDWMEFADHPQTSDLRGMLAGELEITENRWLDLVAHGDSELLNYGHDDCPTCTVREVLWRLGFKEPPDTLTDLANLFGMKYHKFYRFYEDHVLTRAQALLLAPNILTAEQAATVREEIDQDFHGVLQKPLSTKMSRVTVQFLAQQHLWLYRDPPLGFADIANLARERFGYKKLTTEMLVDFWLRKCQQPLAKIVGMIFD
jgi:hypothetical protein